MRFIGSVIEKLQRHPKRIVFPGGHRAARAPGRPPVLFLAPGRADPAGRPHEDQEAAPQSLNVSLEGIRIINPAESEDLDNFARRFDVAAAVTRA